MKFKFLWFVKKELFEYYYKCRKSFLICYKTLDGNKINVYRQYITKFTACEFINTSLQYRLLTFVFEIFIGDHKCEIVWLPTDEFISKNTEDEITYSTSAIVQKNLHFAYRKI